LCHHVDVAQNFFALPDYHKQSTYPGSQVEQPVQHSRQVLRDIDNNHHCRTRQSSLRRPGNQNSKSASLYPEQDSLRLHFLDFQDHNDNSDLSLFQ
jgi:hypothetical protein